ncbi:hypothetical protein [Paenibacillus sp. PAMC21692]|uniref:hypothetical protein n=1 Tax=Paenibacillus sp. PAMC21692 TaxID=2762320 RepID=UPI00164CF9D6|nr:hypothetical protein [Paenibacillus sp. PAMC21692]QNK54549.1 hypothetical protein H7F31_17965 [Paenibacillus sp. PAMC21692]
MTVHLALKPGVYVEECESCGEVQRPPARGCIVCGSMLFRDYVAPRPVPEIKGYTTNELAERWRIKYRRWYKDATTADIEESKDNQSVIFDIYIEAQSSPDIFVQLVKDMREYAVKRVQYLREDFPHYPAITMLDALLAITDDYWFSSYMLDLYSTLDDA